jgi:hypothetical protein
MPEVHVADWVAVDAERVLAAARDFSARRSELFPDVHPDQFVVHQVGDDFAEVTEGNPSPIGPFWERLRYDWSKPGSVKAVVIDSNIFRPRSTWEISATPAEGGSRVKVTMVRHFKGPKGRLVGAVMIGTGAAKRTTAKHLRHFLAEVEARARDREMQE